MSISDFDPQACEEHHNDMLNAFTDAIEEVVTQSLDSNQEVLNVNVTSIVCDTAERNRSRNRILVEFGSATVNYDVTVEETCSSCDKNATVADDLYEQVKKAVSDEIDSGNFASTLQENTDIAELASAFTIDSGYFRYEMMEKSLLSTTSPTASPVNVIEFPLTTPKPTSTSAGNHRKILTSGLVVVLSLML